MRRALELAHLAGRTSPNPPVGAVIAKGSKVLAVGYHRGPGKAHAEVDALKKLKGKAKGATLYVTLEPCCHVEKRTPPCVNAIAESGIARVVIGCLDPNPQVNGKGLRFLRSKGLEVQVGCLGAECEALIRFYAKWVLTGRPFTLLKAAITLDGKIATAQGSSRWITGEASRKKVHALRAEVDAILVGAQTVLLDDPELTVRHVRGKNPLRVVVDSDLSLPLERKVFSGAKKTPTLVATLESQKKKSKVSKLKAKGAELLFCRSTPEGWVDLADLTKQLGARGITSLLVEGGAALFSEFLQLGLTDELKLSMAPKILGGAALDVFSSLRVKSLAGSPLFEVLEVEQAGEDLWIRLRPKGSSNPS